MSNSKCPSTIVLQNVLIVSQLIRRLPFTNRIRMADDTHGPYRTDEKNTPLTVFLAHPVALYSSAILYESFRGLHVDKEMPALITFSSDDGFASKYPTTFPILKERGIPATVFVIATQIGPQGHLNLTQLIET